MPLWGGGRGSNCQEQERSETQMFVCGACSDDHHDRPHTCWRSWNLENQIRSRRLVTRGSSSRWRFGQLSPHSPTKPPLPTFQTTHSEEVMMKNSEIEKDKNNKSLLTLKLLLSQHRIICMHALYLQNMTNVESFSTIWQYSLDSPFLSMRFNNEDICMFIRM